MRDKPGVAVLTPVYNDWKSLAVLLGKLDALKTNPHIGELSYVAVDDASTEGFDRGILQGRSNLEVLSLARNLGHQRAIAVGLAYLVCEKDFDLVVVMDSDGEDRPEDIGSLIEESLKEGGGSVVFAARKKRKEGMLFRAFYLFYQMIFMVLTGRRIRFGNFSAVPADSARRLVHSPDLWNNYPASVMKSRLPMRSIPLERGIRYAGTSKMSLTSLILHGLGAISIFLETIAVRLLLVTFSIAMALLAGIVLVFGLKFLTSIPILGWTSLVLLGLSTILIQSIILILILTFMTLSFRSQKQIIPYYDYTRFIIGVEREG